MLIFNFRFLWYNVGKEIYMEKGKIRKLKKTLSDELLQIEDFFIKDAEENDLKHFEIYKQLESSINGKYVLMGEASDDLIKAFKDFK